MSDTESSSGRTEALPSEASEENQPNQLREYAKRLEMLREIDRAILAAQSPSDIASAALARLRAFVPFIRASVVLFHWERETAEILAIYQKYGETRLEPGVTFPIDDVPIPDALYDGDPEMVPDIETAPDTPITQRLRTDENIRSYVSFPLVVEGDLIGMVNFGADEPGVYAGQWRHIIREVADQLAIAIRQSHLVEQVKTYSRQLEDRVQERTEELESFTYSVSHDLRTPLRAVDGFSRMLMRRYADDLDAEGQRLVRVIHENTQKMSRLIDGLLALSRLGRRTMRRRSVDVEQLAREAFDEARQGRADHATGESESAVEFTVEPLPAAHADRAMLQRVLVNLLSNALKFTRDEASPRITVRAESNDTGETVYVVQDNGVGFDMEYADKLFGVFQRLHDEDAFEGTGIGLAIAERTIRRHNGRIWAESTVGEGAAFYFMLGDEEVDH
jgi:signal transduction histidine kinase